MCIFNPAEPHLPLTNSEALIKASPRPTNGASRLLTTLVTALVMSARMLVHAMLISEVDAERGGGTASTITSNPRRHPSRPSWNRIYSMYTRGVSCAHSPKYGLESLMNSLNKERIMDGARSRLLALISYLVEPKQITQRKGRQLKNLKSTARN